MSTVPSKSSTPEGSSWLDCRNDALDAGEASAWVVVPGAGAVVTFAGTVRDHAEGRTGVTKLEYEAYEEQVVPALERVERDLRKKWPEIGRVVLWHRIGSLDVTDVAVVVAVSTPHRTEAFDAARWAIDEVKATAPIWKREHHDDGVSWGRCDHGGVDSRVDAVESARAGVAVR